MKIVVFGYFNEESDDGCIKKVELVKEV